MSNHQATSEMDDQLLPRLSPREAEVLANASLGLSNGEIAERLHVSVHAVKFHLAAVYRKLGVANRTSATVVYLRAGGQRVVSDWENSKLAD
jgi:DNA-binding NarL/FixJ family response regulator